MTGSRSLASSAISITDWGSRLLMFENFNRHTAANAIVADHEAGGIHGAGPFAEFARKVCGIEIEDTMTEYQATVDYAKAQDAGQRRPNAVKAAAKTTERQKRSWPSNRISYVPLDKMDAKMRAEMEALPA